MTSNNFVSGLLVSFIALPLCVAISLASSFPVLSGIFTAIVGGILISQISGSHLTINGPAAGMIVVILDAVEKLGQGDAILGYKYTLAAIVCASFLQLVISFTKAPVLMRKFPESIIRGMMMSIGLIVIIKQTFILCGFKAPKGGVGFGNLICGLVGGLVGGLPMIAEIVRSTTNVKYGANNKWSNFFHGFFRGACLLVMITVFRDYLKFIPTCLLAGMLIMIGWGMINLQLFAQVFKKDKVDFVVIISVIFFALKIDLLAGILSGIIIHLILQKISPGHVSQGLDQH